MTSRFGTTSDMVIQTVEENGATFYLAIDNKGLYLTTKNLVDRALADSNRYSGNRETTSARLSALGMDPVALLNDNQNKVQVAGKDTSKKVNPLKASKRGMKSK